MKVSIIIPVYNVESYIADCLNSVINQTYNGDLECILVDDCTPDNSCTIIEKIIGEYNGKIQFKLIHHTQNKGLSGARNTGIDNATGDYLYFLDSDDKITNKCIEDLTNPLLRHPYDVVVGHYIEIPGNGPEQGGQDDSFLTNDAVISHFSLFPVMAWNKLVKRSFLISNNLYFKLGLIHEDELWNFQLLAKAGSAFFSHCFTYIYIRRKDSITTGTVLKKHWANYIEVLGCQLSFLRTLTPFQKKVLYPHCMEFQKKIIYDIFDKGTGADRKWGYKLISRLILRNPDRKCFKLKHFLYIFHYYLGSLGFYLFSLAFAFFLYIKRCRNLH